jgi:hypothetical protein
MDFADATLVHLAERESLSTVFSIDHDDFEPIAWADESGYASCRRGKEIRAGQRVRRCDGRTKVLRYEYDDCNWYS